MRSTRPVSIAGVLTVLCGLMTGSCSDPPITCQDMPTSPSCADPRPQQPTSRTLPIGPVAQQTEVWCWAATAEMVFRHYSMPSVNAFGNYQCGIVAAYFGGVCQLDCGLCVAPIASMTELNRVIVNYGVVARQLGQPSATLSTATLFRALSMDEVRQEIDAGRPVVSGITAGGFPFPNISQHVALIVGYEVTGTAATLIVNDPFPYNLPQFVLQGRGNPYVFAGGTEVQPGQYRISYSSYTGFMTWANTIYQIRPS